MLWNSFVVAAALAGTVTALVVPETHAVHEKRDYTSRRWVKRDRVKPHARLPVRIGLAQNNLDKAHDFLMDVSHPSSPNYGKHWSSEEVIEAFKPSDHAVETVRQWLVDAGISVKEIVHSDNKQWLAFDASNKQMESLLHTEYHEYEDVKTGGVMPACDQYHVPKHIQQHIDYITPGIKLMAPLDKKITEEGWKNLEKRWGPPQVGRLMAIINSILTRASTAAGRMEVLLGALLGETRGGSPGSPTGLTTHPTTRTTSASATSRSPQHVSRLCTRSLLLLVTL